MKKIVILTLGGLLFVAGLIVLPLPIPFGAIMMVIATAMIVSQSPYAARQVQWLRARYRHVDLVVRAAEARLPKNLQVIVRLTDPLASAAKATITPKNADPA
ncbi:MAG: hypothetical protein AAFQ44_04675 [Pseudomonadota bacterium]